MHIEHDGRTWQVEMSDVAVGTRPPPNQLRVTFRSGTYRVGTWVSADRRHEELSKDEIRRLLERAIAEEGQ